jgi:hypothetical protein
VNLKYLIIVFITALYHHIVSADTVEEIMTRKKPWSTWGHKAEVIEPYSVSWDTRTRIGFLTYSVEDEILQKFNTNPTQMINIIDKTWCQKWSLASTHDFKIIALYVSDSTGDNKTTISAFNAKNCNKWGYTK